MITSSKVEVIRTIMKRVATMLVRVEEDMMIRIVSRTTVGA
jgi:hypothetical protein